MKIEGYGFVSWRTRRGWSTAHAVIGADTVPPGDCQGYHTVCRRTVPESALEYAEFPKGSIAARKYNGLILLHALAPLGLSPFICLQCQRKLNEKEK